MSFSKSNFSRATVRVIKQRYDLIRKKHGRVDPTLIVEDARNPKSPLHRFFEWDNDAAAEKYRLSQARDMIQRVRVVMTIEGKREPVRVYVSTMKDKRRQYLPLAEVMSSEQSSQDFMLEMRRELENIVRRFEIYKVCAKSVKHVRAAIDALDIEEEKVPRKKVPYKKAA